MFIAIGQSILITGFLMTFIWIYQDYKKHLGRDEKGRFTEKKKVKFVADYEEYKPGFWRKKEIREVSF